MFLKHPGSAVRFGVATLFSCSEAWRYSILNLGIVHFTVTGKNLKSELNGNGSRSMRYMYSIEE